MVARLAADFLKRIQDTGLKRQEDTILQIRNLWNVTSTKVC